MRWLWSGQALRVHVVFGLATALLVAALLAGDAGPAGDYPLGLVFCLVAYPVVLMLVWFKAWADGEVG